MAVPGLQPVLDLLLQPLVLQWLLQAIELLLQPVILCSSLAEMAPCAHLSSCRPTVFEILAGPSPSESLWSLRRPRLRLCCFSRAHNPDNMWVASRSQMWPNYSLVVRI